MLASRRDPQLAEDLSDFIELPSEVVPYVQSPPEDPQTSGFLKLLSKATLDPHFSPKKLCELGLDISVAWFYHRLISPSPGYLSMLKYYDFEPFEAHGSITGFTAFRHANGSRVIVPNIETGMFNPCRCFKKMRNSASRTLKKISAVPPIQFVVHLGLTFPSEISSLMFKAPFDVEPRLWNVYKDFFDRLDPSCRCPAGTPRFPPYVMVCPVCLKLLVSHQLGHQANLHPWGSENPLDAHAHFHADLLGAAKVGDHLRSLPFNHGRPLDHHVVRSLWAQSVSEEFDIELCSCLVTVDLPGLDCLVGPEKDQLGPQIEVCPLCRHKRVDVHLEWSHREWFSEDKSFPYKLLHKIKYRKRGVLIDLAEFYLKREWDSSHASDFLAFLLVFKNKSRSFGFWNNISRFVCECPADTPRLPYVQVCPACLNLFSLRANLTGSLCPLCGGSCTAEKLHFEDIQDAVMAFITRKGKLRLSRWGLDRVEVALGVQEAASTAVHVKIRCSRYGEVPASRCRECPESPKCIRDMMAKPMSEAMGLGLHGPSDVIGAAKSLKHVELGGLVELEGMPSFTTRWGRSLLH